MKPVNATAVFRHDKKVKGGQFKFSADLIAPGQDVVAPVTGKVAHVYKDKTQCGNPGAGSCQITISEEAMVPKGHSGDLTRVLTKRRVALAHFTPVARLSFDPLKHVQAGTKIGVVSGDSLHVASNSAELLDELV